MKPIKTELQLLKAELRVLRQNDLKRRIEIDILVNSPHTRQAERIRNRYRAIKDRADEAIKLMQN